MKTIIFIIGLWFAIIFHAAAQTNQSSPVYLFTLSGHFYDQVKVQHISTNDLMISYVKPNGVMDLDTIEIDDLPPEWKKICETHKQLPILGNINHQQIVALQRISSLDLANGQTLSILKVTSQDPKNRLTNS